MSEIEDYASFLSEAATSEIAVIHEFRILYAQDDRSFHAFFEGREDRLFYVPEVRRRWVERGPLHCHLCNGKPKLTKIRAEVLLLDFDKSRYAFFADRDYDDFLETQIIIDERTYLTDNYSIENDVATLAAVEILLTDFGGMSKADPQFRQIRSAYTKGFDEFARKVLPLSAWIISAKENGERPNLNNVNLGNIFEITSAGGIRKRDNAFEIFRRNVGLPDKGFDCLATIKWARRLRSVHPKKWIRGKYEAWFFRSYLLNLISNEHTRKSTWKIPTPLREDRIFEALGGRLPMPNSLTQFLDQACCAIT